MAHLIDIVMQGDVGRTISVDMGFSLNGYDDLMLRVEKPSGVVVDWGATQAGASASTLEHVTVAGDLDEEGRYKIFPLVTADSGEQIAKPPFMIYVKALPEVGT